jgi:hypothetical protein
LGDVACDKKGWLNEVVWNKPGVGWAPVGAKGLEVEPKEGTDVCCGLDCERKAENGLGGGTVNGEGAGAGAGVPNIVDAGARVELENGVLKGEVVAGAGVLLKGDAVAAGGAN